MNHLDLCYEIALQIETVCFTAITAGCLFLWTRPFLRHPKKAWKVGAAYGAAMLFLHFIPFYINHLLAYLCGALCAFAVMWLTDRAYLLQKLFLALTFFCLRWQATRVGFTLLHPLDEWTRKRFPNENAMFWFRFFVFTMLIQVAVDALLLFVAVKGLLWAYGQRRAEMSPREFLLLSMPSLSGVASYGMFLHYNYIYERDARKSPFDNYGDFDLVTSLFAAACFAVILVMAYTFRLWKEEQGETRAREMFSRQMADLRSHIAEVDQLTRDFRSLRHDMANHLLTLEALYQAGEYAEAESYARSLQGEMQNASGDVSSGSPVTDVVLSGKKKEMEARGIAFACDFHCPMTESVNSFDLSIILNNALANAIEAVPPEQTGQGAATPRRAQISLRSYQRKNMYIIEVSNPFCGELAPEGAEGLPASTKAGEGHGFGLLNIRRAARKYLGDIQIRKEGELCVLRALLQISET